MGKGVKGRRKAKRGDSSSSEEEAEESGKIRPDKDLTFAERRQLQRQAAANKRKQKLKCFLCGQEGHVRRECPGIPDDGRGESKYTGKRQSKVKQKKSNPSSQVLLLQEQLPNGFSKEQSSEDSSVVYFDASCDKAATMEYLSQSHKLSAAEALYRSVIEHTLQSSHWGGMISRSDLAETNRPWNTEAVDEAFEDSLTWWVVGWPRSDLENKEDDDLSSQLLEKTVEEGNTRVVGVYYDLDYSIDRQDGCDRESQLRQLRATFLVAGKTHVPIQVRVLPAYSRLPEQHEQAMEDVHAVLSEMITLFPEIKVHVSCWSGTPADMLKLLANPNVWIGMDATVSFSKAKHLHECAFELPMDRLVLETGLPTTLPSNIPQSRDSFCHSGLIPFIAQAVAKHKVAGTDAVLVAHSACDNTLNLYSRIALQRDVADKVSAQE